MDDRAPLGQAGGGSAVSEAGADVRRGRWFGALLLVQLIAAPVYNFVLLDPVFAKPGWLVNAAPNA